ncbi:MAG: hypothetical protein MR967_03755 [Holdemanella sp.]|uniref:hypothetical protein n=1 Tax=Holdemanella sp. TaxID=1971762 RepID=UPI002588D8ED|nr:hypothetical protein [Holdemanella sp.]MCI7166040.1 hypothetical protein [Holdemanella sp.]
MKNEKYIEVAINLSRMYGVAETLEPLQPKKFIEFDKMIDEWTLEFLENEEQDIVTFFENKIKNL